MSLPDQIKNLIRAGKKDGYILKAELEKCISSFSETDQNYIKNTIEGFKIQIVESVSDYDELKYFLYSDKKKNIINYKFASKILKLIL